MDPAQTARDLLSQVSCAKELPEDDRDWSESYLIENGHYAGRIYRRGTLAAIWRAAAGTLELKGQAGQRLRLVRLADSQATRAA